VRQKIPSNLSRRMHGLSLIELLIAMVLGLTLAAGVIQVYVGNSTTERNQEARGRMQENGRFGLNFLAQEIRMAGFLGCLGGIDPASVNSTLNAPPASFQPAFGIQGWEAQGTAPGVINNSVANVPVEGTGSGEWVTLGGPVIPVLNAIPNSDILRTWSVGGAAGVINSITPAASTQINITPLTIATGDILLLSDCLQADWVQACQIADIGPGVSQTITLSSTCAPGNIANSPITSIVGGEVSRLEGTILFVGKRGNLATNPPALFRARLGNNALPAAAEELIEGVESMQLLYGVNVDSDSRNTVDAYLRADQVTDWSDVITVRVSLLIQSIEDGVQTSPTAYTFNGVNYTGTGGNGALPPDRRVRRVFTSTIALRNRSLGI
jgi:type IV pilus assembly protein PilW